ncbi:hypothetical protein VPH35_090905 [Triticum aestivum]
MASQLVESHRTGAEVHKGNDICKQKTVELLKELGLPKGLFPMDDIEEKINQTVSYDTEVTAFVEKGKMKKVTGVKIEDLSLVEVYMDESSADKVTVKTNTGLFPMDDIEEVGHNCESGFVWMLQKKKNEHTFKKINQTVSYDTEVTSFVEKGKMKKKEHTFKKINQTVSYDTEVTAFVEKGKMKKVTGVKIEEVSLVDVYVDESSADKVTVKTDTGLSDTHDAAVFALGE